MVWIDCAGSVWRVARRGLREQGRLAWIRRACRWIGFYHTSPAASSQVPGVLTAPRTHAIIALLGL